MSRTSALGQLGRLAMILLGAAGAGGCRAVDSVALASVDGGAAEVRRAVGDTSAAGAPLVVRSSRALMSTTFEILISTTEPARAQEAADRAFDEIARLEAILSEWRPASPISQINGAAGERAVAVPPEVIEVLSAANEVSQASGGAFDATWACLRDLWDFRARDAHPPTRAQVAPRLPLIDYQGIVIDRAQKTVMLRRRGMAIGLGGIAKGYALDRAEAVLRAAGIENFILYAGGQVQARGTKAGQPWRVGIRHPRHADRYFAWFPTTGAAISTSGDYEHSFTHDGRLYHHILDPRTGFPARGLSSVTILARDGMRADGLSTAVFVLGAERGMALVERLGNVEAVLVDEQMHVTVSPRLRDRITIEATVLTP